MADRQCEGYGSEVEVSPGALSVSQEARSRLTSPRPQSDTGVTRLRLENRAGSTPQRTGGPWVGSMYAHRAAQDTAVLTAVRRQVEAFEEKLNGQVHGQIARMQKQGDRLRDLAFSRVETKLGSIEALQPKFDRKLAELSGNYKGLSDEMQAQIRRVDHMDTKLWEWGHQLEEKVRAQITDIQQGQQQVASAARVASATAEEGLKQMSNRVRRLENLLEERLNCGEETNHNFSILDGRLQELEKIQELALCNTDATIISPKSLDDNTNAISSAAVVTVEVKLADALKKIERIASEAQDTQSRLETQEERLRSLRTMVDKSEEHYRQDRFDKQSWEGRSKELQALTQELDKYRVEHMERLEIHQNKIGTVEKSHEELSDQLHNMLEKRPSAYACVPDPSSPSPHADGGDSGIYVRGSGGFPCNIENDTTTEISLQDQCSRLDAAEDKLDQFTADLQAVKSDSEIGPRVAALVDSLKQVAPKVMDQENSVRELHEKVGQLEAKMSMTASPSQNHSARLGVVEVDVARLKVLLGAPTDGCAFPPENGETEPDFVK